jgi:hypothetical protein
VRRGWFVRGKRSGLFLPYQEQAGTLSSNELTNSR